MRPEVGPEVGGVGGMGRVLLVQQWRGSGMVAAASMTGIGDGV